MRSLRKGARPKGLAVSGLLMTSAEAGQRLSQAACFFLLAAVLSPHDFGLAAAAFLALQVVNSLTYAGLGQAVQALGAHRDRDATAQALALISGTLGMLAMVLAAAPVSRLLHAPDAVNLLRLASFTLPLTQFAEIKAALIERRGGFARTASAQLVASSCSAAIGISLALAGVGPAALIAQGIVQQAVRLAVLCMDRAHPVGIGWEWNSFRELWSVGRHLLATGVLNTAYGNADNAVVGAIRGPADLGGYGFVYNLANMPYYLVGPAINRVMLPTYVSRLSQGLRVRSDFERSVFAVGTLVALPLGYLLVAGPDALVVLFGSKWDFVGPTLQLLTVFAWLRTLASSAVPILVAMHLAHRQRQAQTCALVGMLILVVPLTAWRGTLGTAIAVAIPQAAVGGWLLREAAGSCAARPRALLVSASIAAMSGGVAGVAAEAIFRKFGHRLYALPLSVTMATLAWAFVIAIARPSIVRSVRMRYVRMRVGKS